MQTVDIKKMSIKERSEIMEEIWESLLESETEIDSPDWHVEILEARKRRIEEGKAEFISFGELKKETQRRR